MFKPLRNSARSLRPRLSAVLPPLEFPSSVTVRGESRPLKVRHHAQAKRMTLRFDPRSGAGRVTAPVGTPPSAILTFLSQSRTWIDAHAPELPAEDKQPFPNTILLAGEPHQIIPTGKTRGLVEQMGSQALSVPGAPHRIMPRLAQFLKSEAERELTPMAMAFAAKINRLPSAVRFRDPRSQWGSCNSKRVVTLSWRVMMTPPEAQRYLVAHEVAHLKEMNHSRRFWATVEEIEPNWKTGQKVLKRFEKQVLSVRFT